MKLPPCSNTDNILPAPADEDILDEYDWFREHAKALLENHHEQQQRVSAS